MIITIKKSQSVGLILAIACFFSTNALAGQAEPPLNPGFGCGDTWSDCGLDIKVKCNSIDNTLFSGSGLEIYDGWVYEYEFRYDGHDVCDSGDEVAFADTNKKELKCTEKSKGNGKGSNEITVEMEIAYDESKDHCYWPLGD